MCPVMCYVPEEEEQGAYFGCKKVQHDVMIIMGCVQENMGTHRKALCSPSRRGDSEVGLENEFHQANQWRRGFLEQSEKT